MDKDPANWTFFTWLLALIMPFGGGLINWYSKVKTGQTRSFNIIELIGELFVSGFVGLGVFMVLASLGQPSSLCAPAAGVSGHMAARLLFLIERALEAKLLTFIKIEERNAQCPTDKV